MHSIGPKPREVEKQMDEQGGTQGTQRKRHN